MWMTSNTPCVFAFHQFIFLCIVHKIKLVLCKIHSVSAFESLYWMSSLDKTDRIIINLKVISTLCDGQRLCVRNNMFSIYEPGWMQALTRWLYSEDRWANMEDIQVEVNDALRIMGTYMTLMQTTYGVNAMATPPQQTVGQGALPVPPPETCASFVSTLAKELHSAVHGLQSLQRTYPDDKRMVATLAVLIERIQSEIEKAQRLMSRALSEPSLTPAPSAAPSNAPAPLSIPRHPKQKGGEA